MTFGTAVPLAIIALFTGASALGLKVDMKKSASASYAAAPSNYQFTSQQGGCRGYGNTYGGYCKCSSVAEAKQSAQDCLNYVIIHGEDTTGLAAAEFHDGSHCYGFYLEADAPTGKCPTGCTAHEGNADVSESANGGAYGGDTDASANALCLFADEDPFQTWGQLVATTTTTTAAAAPAPAPATKNFSAAGLSVPITDVAWVDGRGYDFRDDVHLDISATHFPWSTGDFTVSITVTPKSTNSVSGDSQYDYGALFIKSSQFGSPFTGPTAFLYDDGRVQFRLANTDALGSSNIGSVSGGWRANIPVKLTFIRASDKLYIYEGIVLLSSVSITPAAFSVSNSAPFRIGGNHQSEHLQSLNVYLSSMSSSNTAVFPQAAWCTPATDRHTSPGCTYPTALANPPYQKTVEECKSMCESDPECRAFHWRSWGSLSDVCQFCTEDGSSERPLNSKEQGITLYKQVEYNLDCTPEPASAPAPAPAPISAWELLGTGGHGIASGGERPAHCYVLGTAASDAADDPIHLQCKQKCADDAACSGYEVGQPNVACQTIYLNVRTPTCPSGMTAVSMNPQADLTGIHTYSTSTTWRVYVKAEEADYCVGKKHRSDKYRSHYQIRAGSNCDRGGYHEEHKFQAPTAFSSNTTVYCVGIKGGPETGFDTYRVHQGRHCGASGGYSGYTHHMHFYAPSKEQAYEIRKSHGWQEVDTLTVTDNNGANSKYKFDTLEDAKDACLRNLECGGVYQHRHGKFIWVIVPGEPRDEHGRLWTSLQGKTVTNAHKLLKGKYEGFCVGEDDRRTMQYIHMTGDCETRSYRHRFAFYAKVPPRDCTGAWSEWGTCSQSCGGGVSQRSWVTTRDAAYGGTCVNEGVSETAACNEQSCACDADTACAAGQFCEALECQACPASSMSLVANLAAISSSYTFDSAAPTAGATAFASGSLEGSCSYTGAGSVKTNQSTGAACFSNINDDQFGDGSAWIASSAGYTTNLGGSADESVNFVGVTFKQKMKVYGISVSRDATGALNDRFGGNNRVQYHDSKGASFDSLSWCDAGSFERTGAGVLFYKFSTPITATAIRIITDSADAAFDDLKVYTTRPPPKPRQVRKRKVKSSMTLKNVVLSEMTTQGKSKLKADVRTQTATDTGVDEEYIVVTLSEAPSAALKSGAQKVESTERSGGGVKIDTEIDLPEEASATAVVAKMGSAALRSGVATKAEAVLATEPAAATTGAIVVEAPAVTTETEAPTVRQGDWMLGFKVLKGIVTGLAGTNDEIDGKFQDFLRQNKKVMITWNTEAEISAEDSEIYTKYEKAVEFTVPVPTDTSVASMSNSNWGSLNSNLDQKTCNDATAFSPVTVSCKWGACEMPTQMYTGVQFQKLCDGTAYGLVGRGDTWSGVGGDTCYGKEITEANVNSQNRFLFAGTSDACNGYADIDGHFAKGNHTPAIAVWFQKDVEGHGHGDPHLKNMRGEDFDVMQEGQMLLLETPRQSTPENLNFAIRADIDRLGAAACGPTYITSLYLTGCWLGQELEFHSGHIMETPGVNEKHAFGLRVNQKRMSHASFKQKYGKVLELSSGATVRPRHRAFQVSIKSLELFVSQPKRPRIFLDMQIKGLETLEGEVGGLLGIDDHSEAEKLPEECLVAM